MRYRTKTITRWTDDNDLIGEWNIEFRVSPCPIFNDVEISDVRCNGKDFDLTTEEYEEIRDEYRIWAREGAFNV